MWADTCCAEQPNDRRCSITGKTAAPICSWESCVCVCASPLATHEQTAKSENPPEEGRKETFLWRLATAAGMDPTNGLPQPVGQQLCQLCSCQSVCCLLELARPACNFWFWLTTKEQIPSNAVQKTSGGFYYFITIINLNTAEICSCLSQTKTLEGFHYHIPYYYRGGEDETHWLSSLLWVWFEWNANRVWGEAGFSDASC